MLPTARFEPGSSGMFSEHAVNCGTTTVSILTVYNLHICRCANSTNGAYMMYQSFAIIRMTTVCTNWTEALD